MKKALPGSSLLHHNNPTMTQQIPGLKNLSVAELAGHASFLCVTAAYLNTEILVLRYLSCAGFSLSVLFQYYRPSPLWIPIRWNVLLLAVNFIMATTLTLERRRAQQMESEMEDLYVTGLFQKRGFSRVDFCRFFSIGIKKHIARGEKLTRDGHENHTLYLLVKGRVTIQKAATPHITIATIRPHHFIGEMAFLNYADDDIQDNAVECRAIADSTVDSMDGCIVWQWSYDELDRFTRNHRGVRNALSAYINHDLRAKLSKTTRHECPKLPASPDASSKSPILHTKAETGSDPDKRDTSVEDSTEK